MNDVVDFSISGGELIIDKKIFVRELLKPQSALKRLLNYKITDGEKTRSLEVDKNNAHKVIIDFNFVDNVKVGGDYESLLKELKSELKETISGEVVLTAFYWQMITVKLDLNSSDGEIKVLTQ